ncbi:MAG TPA: DUF2064 domain-containing protein [Acidimicrobiales bacterium]
MTGSPARSGPRVGQHVLVMAKAPVPGRVKTRLCPPYSYEEAADIAAAALADTLAAVAAGSATRKIIALEGRPGPWLPPGFEVIAQRGDGLDERLAHAWVGAGGPGIQIGMDTPQVTAGELDQVLAAADAPGRAAVLGHAADGGWWVIGWRRADPWAVFRGVPMSTPRTGAAQERRLRRLGFVVTSAPVQRDIDTAADLSDIAESHPGLRTARLASRLGAGVGPVEEVA